jgi:hypothetical protein
MILKQLSIFRKSSWDEKCDSPLVGTIEFKNDLGSIKLELSEEMAQKILAVVAEGVVESAKEVATKLTSNLLMQSAPALEHRSVISAEIQP